MRQTNFGTFLYRSFHSAYISCFFVLRVEIPLSSSPSISNFSYQTLSVCDQMYIRSLKLKCTCTNTYDSLKLDHTACCSSIHEQHLKALKQRTMINRPKLSLSHSRSSFLSDHHMYERIIFIK